MKRFFAVLLAVLLMAAAVVPAYAAPYDADWIPPVPGFIKSIPNGFQISVLSMSSLLFSMILISSIG